ncbi:MAG: hypothetical protein Q9214_002440 [Letrouitia sp. 1 TL-2023]
MAPQEPQPGPPHSLTSNEHSDLKCHRTTRASVTGKRVIYENEGESTDSSTNSYPNDDPRRGTSQVRSLHNTSRKIFRTAKNPFAEPVSDEWESLAHLDRRLFKLRKGTPSNQTLPLKWCQVAEKLIEESFSPENLQSWGGWPVLASRYEVIRLKLEAFFGAKPEPAGLLEWDLMYAEDFDVYDLKSGEKYWHHSHDAVVRPALDRKGGQGHIKLGEVLRDGSEEP